MNMAFLPLFGTPAFVWIVRRFLRDIVAYILIGEGEL